APGRSCLGRKPLPPVGPLQHIADLHELLAVHVLEGEAAVADELPRGLEYERPLAETMLLIGPAGAIDRLGGLLAAVRARVEAHGLGGRRGFRRRRLDPTAYAPGGAVVHHPGL